MINVFTLIGIAFSFFAILLIVYGLIFILRDYKNVNKAEWRKYQIRYYKDTIDSMLYDTNNSGYKVMFRDPECKGYTDYHIHIATQDDEEIIVIDLGKIE